MSSIFLRCVGLVRTDVLEESVTSIFRVMMVPFILLKPTDAYKEHIASIFRVE
jgi:hypothetical protein